MKNVVPFLLLILGVAFISCGTNSKTREIKESDFIITNSAIGEFSIGSPMETIKDSMPWVFEKSTKIVSEEGEEIEKITINVSDTTETLLNILVADIDGKESIGEFSILSEKFETKKGISVGSAIVEFMHKYRDFEIWYSYVGNTYVIQSKSLSNVNFILDKTGVVTEVDPTSDMISLNPTDFKPETKIVEIRIY